MDLFSSVRCVYFSTSQRLKDLYNANVNCERSGLRSIPCLLVPPDEQLRLVIAKTSEPNLKALNAVFALNPTSMEW